MEQPPARRADDLDAELEEMEQQSDRLGDQIDDTRADWERKQRDDSVPGASGTPESERRQEGDD